MRKRKGADSHMLPTCTHPNAETTSHDIRIAFLLAFVVSQAFVCRSLESMSELVIGPAYEVTIANPIVGVQDSALSSDERDDLPNQNAAPVFGVNGQEVLKQALSAPSA